MALGSAASTAVSCRFVGSQAASLSAWLAAGASKGERERFLGTSQQRCLETNVFYFLYLILVDIRAYRNKSFYCFQWVSDQSLMRRVFAFDDRLFQ